MLDMLMVFSFTNNLTRSIKFLRLILFLRLYSEEKKINSSFFFNIRNKDFLKKYLSLNLWSVKTQLIQY